MTRTYFTLFAILFLAGCVAQQQSHQTQQPSIQTPVQPAGPRKTTIALLLPLSGGAAELGKSAMDAAKMALFDLKSKDVILKPYDTPGDANRAHMNADRAIKEGAEIIIGPVFSTDARAITQITQPAGVPVLSLSNTPEIAAHGIYPMGYNPAAQTRHITEHLLSQGKTKIATLAPNTRYGQLCVTALKHALESKGQLVREVFYDKSSHDFSLGIEQLQQHLNPGDIDALFLPERGERLSNLIEKLKEKGITSDRIKFFGPDSWKDLTPQICSSMNSSIFSSPDSYEYEKFKLRFQSTYGYCPSETASIAYDLVALIAAHAADGEKITNEVLTNPQGFKGIDGPFRLFLDGHVERHYAVYEVGNNSTRIILPPARDFQ